MSFASTITGGQRVDILNVTKTASLPTGSIGDTQISSTNPIAEEKLEKRYSWTWSQSGNLTNCNYAVHCCSAATGTVDRIRVGYGTAATSTATGTLDVKKNGTTILSAAVTVNSSLTQLFEPTISVTALAEGDVLTVVVTGASAGAGALAIGVAVHFDVIEAAV